jgi:molecular chaperone GrpE (heat shock protein)
MKIFCNLHFRRALPFFKELQLTLAYCQTFKQRNIKFNEEEFEKLTLERDDYKDKYYRLAADFENARKRMDRERQEFYNTPADSDHWLR